MAPIVRGEMENLHCSNIPIDVSNPYFPLHDVARVLFIDGLKSKMPTLVSRGLGNSQPSSSIRCIKIALSKGDGRHPFDRLRAGSGQPSKSTRRGACARRLIPDTGRFQILTISD